MRFGPHPSSSPERPGDDVPEISQLAQQMRAIFESGIAGLVKNLFVRIDDELFTLSDKADSSTSQSVYFEAMRQVRREKDALQAVYLGQLLADYDRYWSPLPESAQCSTVQSPPPAEGDLSLVEYDVLEIELAVTSAADKGNTRFAPLLQELELRFSTLRDNQALPKAPNPAAPETVCRTFAGAIAALPLDIRIALLILKLFERHVICKMEPIYQQMNDFLAENGVLPRAVRQWPKPATELSDETAPPPTPRSTEQEEPSFRELQHLLEAWRQHLGTEPCPGSGGAHFDAGDVVNALSLLQQSPGVWTFETEDATGIPLKQSLVEQLAKLLPDGDRRRLGRLEEDTIDMVSMIFDFILEDRNLPDPVKALIARLQIPVVKVAIIERSFLAKKTHPLRQLLNALAQAGIGLDLSEKKDQAVLKKIEEIVYRILTEFDEDTRLFAVLLDDFTAFADHEGRTIQAVEERLRQTNASQERLALAKRAAVMEITARIKGQSMPAAAVSLLLNAWKDVLVLAYLRRDKEPADWDKALSLMDELVAWAVSHDETILQPEVRDSGMEIIQAIREQLESISFDPVQAQAFLRDIEFWHQSRCSLVLPNGAAPHGQTETSDPNENEGQTEILYAGDRTPPLADMDLNDIEEILIEGIEGSELRSSDPRSVDDKFIDQARNLNAGDWVEFSGNQALPFRGKLLLKSQLTSHYVFVNRRGMKIREISVQELARGLADDSIRVITGATEPLLDRALNAVVDTLERSAEQGGNASSAPQSTEA
ncbi:MAG: DUF1631 domain-containing protein [Methylococcus sp.]|nr:DUF1631 domain-containing protein [Methylococcus sp.]